MSISVNGFNENVLTFKADSSVKVNSPVKLSSNDTVSACAAGNAICGVAVNADAGYAGVQLLGFVTLPYTGPAPSVGLSSLCADGTGGVKTGDVGKKYLVTNVNTEKSTVSFML